MSSPVLLDLGTSQELGIGGDKIFYENLNIKETFKLEVVWQHSRSHGKNQQVQIMHTSKCKQSTPSNAKSKQRQQGANSMN